ncbi:MAG: ADP-ribosylation factor-like protein [Promethearchaeota archaeon]
MGKNFQDLDRLNIYNYPEDIIKIDDKDLISKIIYGHDHGDLIRKYRESKKKSRAKHNNQSNLFTFIIDSPVPQFINKLNILTTCINGKIIIGLIFDRKDNPIDYKGIFEELINELLNNESSCSFDDEIEIENFLITIFIDIRRYGDEYIDKYPEIEFHYQEKFNKVFLFGLDEVGKSSLIRRIKTGEYNDNYFMPTKKFNIEYIQREGGLLAIWDMPGQIAFRKKWLIGLQDSNIIIFMIDVSNQLRFNESKKEFWKILNRYELMDVPLIILGNKIDLINNVDQSNENDNDLSRLKNELFEYYELDKINDRIWKFLFTSVKTNYNINNVVESIFKLIES